jgi:hypothetical protein
MKKSAKIKADDMENLLWRLESDYAISDPSGQIILSKIREAQARLTEARVILAHDGIVTEDRWGQKKMHPAFLVERDSRSAILKGLHDLHLDIEPLRDKAGRPPGR